MAAARKLTPHKSYLLPDERNLLPPRQWSRVLRRFLDRQHLLHARLHIHHCWVVRPRIFPCVDSVAKVDAEEDWNALFSSLFSPAQN
jgi:hypothetical protein